MHTLRTSSGERFADRADAGRRLTHLLGDYAGREDVLVFGLPRGGVPVAAEVARALSAPLDVMVVRKLGAPGHEELAMGAIASGGARVLNGEVIEQLGVSAAALEAETVKQQAELARREHAYRGARAFPDIAGKVAIVVDDGYATGATMRVAVQALRQYHPREIVVAVPVAPPHVEDATLRAADRVVVLLQPTPFLAVGHWYCDFAQTEDEEVRRLLAEGAR